VLDAGLQQRLASQEGLPKHISNSDRSKIFKNAKVLSRYWVFAK
jgi:hypothetical protein